MSCFKPRFDRGIYRDCKFCHATGRNGCLACEAERDKEYHRQFPEGAKPIATFLTDDPADMERARGAIGVEALQKAFGDGGGGIVEIIRNIADERSTA